MVTFATIFAVLLIGFLVLVTTSSIIENVKDDILDKTWRVWMKRLVRLRKRT